MNKIKLTVVALAGGVALLGGTALATPDQENKEYVCHFTASEKNPLVVVNVGNSAVPHHIDNHHPDVHPGHDSSSNEPPADCPTNPEGGE